MVMPPLAVIDSFRIFPDHEMLSVLRILRVKQGKAGIKLK